MFMSNSDLPAKYASIQAIYDDVSLTTNRNILAVMLNNKVGLITKAGYTIIPCKYAIDKIKLKHDILELIEPDGTYTIRHITISKDLTAFKEKILLTVARSIKEPDAYIVNINNKSFEKVKHEIMTPKLMRVCRNIIGIALHNESIDTIMTKNGVVTNNEVYFNIIEVKSKKQILGVKHASVPKSGIIRPIHILDDSGRIIRKTYDWDLSSVQEYGVTSSELYKRNLEDLDEYKKIYRSWRNHLHEK